MYILCFAPCCPRSSLVPYKNEEQISCAVCSPFSVLLLAVPEAVSSHTKVRSISSVGLSLQRELCAGCNYLVNLFSAIKLIHDKSVRSLIYNIWPTQAKPRASLQTRPSVIKSVTHPFLPTALLRCHGQTVKDSSSSYKIVYSILLKNSHGGFAINGATSSSFYVTCSAQNKKVIS